MSWETDERDAALEKLRRIEEHCHWVQRRQLRAHQWVVREILAIINGPSNPCVERDWFPGR